jgi:hypothetical protein
MDPDVDADRVLQELVDYTDYLLEIVAANELVAAAATPTVSPLQQLRDMGYDHKAANAALVACGGSVALATQTLQEVIRCYFSELKPEPDLEPGLEQASLVLIAKGDVEAHVQEFEAQELRALGLSVGDLARQKEDAQLKAEERERNQEEKRNVFVEDGFGEDETQLTSAGLVLRFGMKKEPEKQMRTAFSRLKFCPSPGCGELILALGFSLFSSHIFFASFVRRYADRWENLAAV